jgi:hypothetical protein
MPELSVRSWKRAGDSMERIATPFSGLYTFRLQRKDLEWMKETRARGRG